MKIGDLIRDPETGDVGILVEIDYESPERRFNQLGNREPYRVVNTAGSAYWFEADYIENRCEIISKSS